MNKSSVQAFIKMAFFLLLVVAGIGLLSSCNLAAAPTPAATPSLLTTNLVVDTSKLSNYKFEVPSNTNLTLSSTDGKKHSCTILGINKAIEIPQGKASAFFQLASGEYKLNCGIPNINANIKSK